ncbi:hypothetical protein NXC14_CH03396 [Rhizobium sp. NXC14]|uniref:DUF488 domain-containing protein n=1 Tax=Rhizobium sp. NXC14 TaxID=1981173 RepID=UPI000A208040|nr:DUF488 domain-containing protein [Rhizobium sp. NXC14]ARO31300.1 hypothetical protein NXC14_CH03396 [Rhizobium sp. NXC14]
MSSNTQSTLFTIGHSTHTYEKFLSLLLHAGITAIADVRSSPFSKHFSHFNGDTLKRELRKDGIEYSFLGEELGGRPTSPDFFCEGVADYEKMAKADKFKRGLSRVIEGARTYQVALMCSEHNPLDCHRCLLVGRALKENGLDVRHILSDGRIRSHRHIEDNLLALLGNTTGDLFMPAQDRLSAAYRDRASKVAYALPVHRKATY